ncbi:serine/threonine-protein kinase csk1 [Amylocarpus encephaloides]|uniref:cyclin-dependent kinase n=1 Tax=Amylocarpus encephaloides TaxID=45428 RepID=A0A9P8C0V2_9HELO|nr:serine/threonine-protein kinase csk1 [Amylocarpus encephaloides]
MTSACEENWRSELKATVRYDKIEKLSTGTSHKAAFAIETEAYNNSDSRATYENACNAILEYQVPRSEELGSDSTIPRSPGISIGQYTGCHHLASGLASEIYRSTTVALKVITETRNVEPHNAAREVKILSNISHASIVRLVSTFKDVEGRLVLVFPYMPLTLAKIIQTASVPESLIRVCFHDLLSALAYLHSNNIIHRDVKPSNVLLSSPTGPAYLADFGTSWHPTFSLNDEPADYKVIEVGTTCYRAPETLFGNRSYNASLDMWATGTMLAECLRKPPKPLFESRDTSEDGNQLGLILSIFKRLGTPTIETWPEAEAFSTPPFLWYQEFPGKSWEDLLPEVSEDGRDLIRGLVCYESRRRLSATEALKHQFLNSFTTT